MNLSAVSSTIYFTNAFGIRRIFTYPWRISRAKSHASEGRYSNVVVTVVASAQLCYVESLFAVFVRLKWQGGCYYCPHFGKKIKDDLKNDLNNY